MSNLLTALTSTTLANGYAVALALVVFLQYVHSVTLRMRSRRSAHQYLREVEGLSIEVLQLSRERGLQRLENQILRDVLSQSDCQKAMTSLLRRFIVNPDDAFGVFVLLDPSSDLSNQSRGLSEESLKNLTLDHPTLQRIREDGAIVWSPPTFDSCSLFSSLSAADRRKARQLFLVGLGDEQGLLGVLIATTLLPIAGQREEQIELTTRLLSSIAPNLRQTLELKRQSVQLRCTREMLELRSLADSKFSTPNAMIEKFLTRLGQMVDAERATLFLNDGGPGTLPRCTARCGPQLQPGIAQRWNEHEEHLALLGINLESPTFWDTAQLVHQGVDTLIASAAVIPLHDGTQTLGVACLTRRAAQGFSTSQRQLLAWAGESLSHTLERALSFVAIQKQAQQDGLTGLANRRTFDEKLLEAVSGIRAGSLVECTLLLLDMDHFKSINDEYGHQLGDDVLKASAETIRAEVSRMRSRERDRAVAARYGGEEMALLLPGVGINGALRIGEELRQAIARQTFSSQRGSLRVTTSIGVASCPLHADTAQSLVQAADCALYRAKSEGRNRVMSASG